MRWNRSSRSSFFFFFLWMGQKNSREEESSPAAAAVEAEASAEGTTRSEEARKVAENKKPVAAVAAVKEKRSSFSSLREKRRGTKKSVSSLRVDVSGKRKAEEMFDRYRGVAEDSEEIEELELSEQDAIGPNGIAALLGDLGLMEDDIVSFVVAWKLGAGRLARITRTEFLSG